MSPLDQQYLDLFDGQSDSELERLVIDLDTISQPLRLMELPQRHDEAIKRAFHKSMIENTKEHACSPRSRVGLLASHRLLLVAVVVFSFLVITSTAFAGIPLINQALQWQDTRSQQVSHHQLGQTVHLLQRGCGFTMSIERVYADANDIVIGYTIQAPLARTFMGGFTLSSPTLTDTEGRVYPVLQGGGTGSIDNQTGNAILFDAGGVTNLPHMLDLHLHLSGITTSERVNNSTHSFAPCESYTPFKQDEVPQGFDSSKLRKVIINSPLVFNVLVPFSSGKVVDLHQKVTSNGTIVRLDHVVITPLETRFYVSGITLATKADLSFHNRIIHSSQSRSLEPGNIVYSFTDTVLIGQHGIWKFVIASRPDLAKVTPGGAVTGGPWVFLINIS